MCIKMNMTDCLEIGRILSVYTLKHLEKKIKNPGQVLNKKK